MKVKQCSTCRIDFPLDCFYVGTCSDGKASRCKHCTKKASYAARELKRSLGLKTDDPMPPTGERSYLDRHLKRREEEAALASTFERVEREASPIHFQDAFCFIERKPMFTGFVRKQTKQFSWRAA